MNKTHYERYFEECGRFLPVMRHYIDYLRKTYPGEEWNYFTLGCAGRHPDVEEEKRGSAILKETPVAAEAFCLNLMRNWLTDGLRSDEPLSLSRSLLTNKNLNLFYNAMIPRVGQANTQTMIEICYQLLSHDRAGKKVYEVLEPLADKLMHTELRGLKSEDLMLPFANIYITVPKLTNLKMFNVLTGWHDVVGIYITEDKNGKVESSRNGIHMNANGDICSDHGKKYADLKSVREWNLMVVGGPGKDTAGNPIPGDDALFYFRMYFPEELSLDKVIAETSRQHTPDSGNNSVLQNQKILDAMESPWKEIFKFAMNVVVYATYTDPGEMVIGNPEARKLWERIQKMPISSRKRANLISKGAKVPDKKRLLLGKNIPLSRHGSVSFRLDHTAGSAMSVRVRVTGHWRRVPHGPGRLARRLTWIEPFWRGPDAADVISNRHVLR